MGEGKNWKRELTEDIILITLALVIVWSGSVGLQLYLGTPTPLRAVESGSMEPVMYRGDLVIVRAVDPETLQVGDVIIFQAYFSEIPVVHRIIQITQQNGELQFTTKGDNNPGPDPLYRVASDIIAKVIGTVRYLGFISLLLLFPGGFHTIVLIFVVLIVTSILCGSIPKSTETEKIIQDEPQHPDSF